MRSDDRRVSFGCVWDRPGEVLLARDESGRLRLLRLQTDFEVALCGCCSVERLIVHDELDGSFREESECHGDWVTGPGPIPSGASLFAVSLDSLSDAERASLPHEFLDDLAEWN